MPHAVFWLPGYFCLSIPAPLAYGVPWVVIFHKYSPRPFRGPTPHSDSVCPGGSPRGSWQLGTEEPAAFLSCRYAAALTGSSFWGGILTFPGVSLLSPAESIQVHPTESIHHCFQGFRFVSPGGGRKDSLSNLAFITLALRSCVSSA